MARRRTYGTPARPVERLIKLTNPDGTTNYATQQNYKPGAWVSKPETLAFALCTSAVLHAFRNQHVAELHVDQTGCTGYHQWWVAEGTVVVENQDKVGCRDLRVLRRTKRPAWTASTKLAERMYHAVRVILLATLEGKELDPQDRAKIVEYGRSYGQWRSWRQGMLQLLYIAATHANLTHKEAGEILAQAADMVHLS